MRVPLPLRDAGYFAAATALLAFVCSMLFGHIDGIALWRTVWFVCNAGWVAGYVAGSRPLGP